MADNQTPLLEIKELEVTYSSSGKVKHALNGVSFELNAKETLGIVGETGAGKTTTALSIMRLLPERTARITGGDVLFQGESLLKRTEADMRAIRGAHISMIFQDPMSTLNPLLTVGTQIEESLILHNASGASHTELKNRVNEVLEMVGIPHSRSSAYPQELSGGMKQRVVIAMALACDPILLIADEPTSALDVTIQAQVLRMMEDLKQSLNMSMLMITHDLGIIARSCDKVAVMYAGEIVEKGTIEDIYTPGDHHPYTEGLFGAIPDLTRSSKRLQPIYGMMPDPAALPKGCKFEPRCKAAHERCKCENPQAYGHGSHQIKCFLYESRGEQ